MNYVIIIYASLFACCCRFVVCFVVFHFGHCIWGEKFVV